MFDDPFVFFTLLIAIVALIFARKAMNEVAKLRGRLDAIQTASATTPALVPPPLTPFEAFERTLPPASTAAAATPPPIVPDVESVGPQNRPPAPPRHHRRCRNPTVASRKPLARAGWCGSAG